MPCVLANAIIRFVGNFTSNRGTVVIIIRRIPKPRRLECSDPLDVKIREKNRTSNNYSKNCPLVERKSFYKIDTDDATPIVTRHGAKSPERFTLRYDIERVPLMFVHYPGELLA